QKIFMGFGIPEGYKYDEGYFDFTGLIYDGRYGNDQGKGVKKLAYYTYKKMTEILAGSDWKSIKTVQQKDNIHIYRLNKNGKAIWVAWNDSGTSKSISLQMEKHIQKVTVTDAVPHYASGKDIDPARSIFQKMTAKITGNPSQLDLVIGKSPVFIEEI
ncbi:MAG: hypothetical protein D3910_27305, partial [Candidatus Electrothrix sp. ATG2]|nr:hypothetical protein [Candidatus Electrothrix sp. ATG2]